jgi:hypothetical protein
VLRHISGRFVVAYMCGLGAEEGKLPRDQAFIHYLSFLLVASYFTDEKTEV